MQDMPMQRYKALRPHLVTVNIGAYEGTVGMKTMPLGLCS